MEFREERDLARKEDEIVQTPELERHGKRTVRPSKFLNREPRLMPEYAKHEIETTND